MPPSTGNEMLDRALRLMVQARRHGQYRDVSYINKDGTPVETRCLIIPAKIVELLIEG